MINTAPLGVVIFDMATGKPRSYNYEARRIADSLSDPGQSLEDVIRKLTFRRADGREVSLLEFPLAQLFSTGEWVRTEEVVLQVSNGRQLTTLVNATPVPAGEDGVATVVVTVQDMPP